MTISPRLLAAGSALALGSCTALPPKPLAGLLAEEPPGGWQAAGVKLGGVDDGWIASFNDRRLTALAEEAQAGNPDLKIAAARIDQAVNQAKLAGADLFPMADFNLNGSRQKQNFIGFPFGASDSGSGGAAAGGQAAAPMEPSVLSNLSNRFGASLDISWEIDLWGRIRAGQSAALAQLQAVSAETRSLQSSVAAQVAKSYFALAEADAQIGIAKDALASFRDTEGQLRDKLALGEPASGAQVRLAMADIAGAEASIEERRGQRELAARQLEALLGRYPRGEAGAALPAMPKAPPAGVPAELLARRPDIIAAERNAAAMDKRILEAKLAALPQISLTGSGGTATEKLRELVNTDFSVWSLAGNIAQPLFTGGQVVGNYNLRKAEAREAVARYQKTALNAFREVETALALESILARQEAALKRAESASQEAYDEAVSAYRTGTGDVLTLLQAQRGLLQARSAALSIRRLRLENRVDLHLALGGDFKARSK